MSGYAHLTLESRYHFSALSLDSQPLPDGLLARYANVPLSTIEASLPERGMIRLIRRVWRW